ncbi:MAG: nuclear transport factor 2 family protein [Chlorobium sp.]|uniref:nuclear transport factor 2 family protein n=1 Tax=Chlorobium sp. TaxID=1095 RepID=UPI0025C2DBBB|nr:nuclear transport factor 2 family protein [Chlorobium sp.]MCF8383212.1 nuclear transport factor 2 family protein [Chlorobium sp.]
MSAFRIFFPLVVSLLCAMPIRAAEKPAQQTGEKLVRQLFIDMKSTNIPAIQKTISPAFQSIHQDGPRNRDQQIELVKGLKMAMPVLGDFVETRSGNILIVTYTVSAEESVGGKRLTGKPARRLTVFQETPEGWRWVAHANLQIMQ